LRRQDVLRFPCSFPQLHFRNADVVDAEILAWLINPDISPEIAKKDQERNEHNKPVTLMRTMQSHGFDAEELRQVRGQISLDDLMSVLRIPFHVVLLQVTRWNMESRQLDQLQEAEHCNDAALSVQNAHVACQLCTHLEPILYQKGLAQYMHQVELPIAEIIAHMDWHGLKIDVDELVEQENCVKRELFELQSRYALMLKQKDAPIHYIHSTLPGLRRVRQEANLNFHWSTIFNLEKPDHVRTLLYNEKYGFGITPPPQRTPQKRHSSGDQPLSTKKEHLDELLAANWVPADVRMYFQALPARLPML
jgi:hypothetical protein